MDKYETYKAHWKRRREKEKRRRQALAVQAKAEAARLGQLLLTELGATKVYLFGSLTRDEAFRHDSDIDLAAEGIAPGRFFKAGVALSRACDYRYRVDLIDLDAARKGLREMILREGELLGDRA